MVADTIQGLPWSVPAPEKRAAQVNTTSCGLPNDLLDQALGRLTYLAAIVGVTFLFSLVTAGALHAFAAWRISPAALGARLVVVLSAAALYWVVRHTAVDRQIKAKLGLVFEVIGAFGLAIFEVMVYRTLDFELGAVSSVCLWILVFRLIVPARSIDAFLVAFLAAAAVPLAQLLSAATSSEPVAWQVVAIQTKTALGTALIAWLGSRGIYKMGTAVAEARTMGSYELTEPIGMGGMGEVWRADHALLKRPAAVKLVRPDALGFLDPAARDLVLQRFEREALATAQLHSAHTVTLFDFGKTPDNGFYYVMELLDGIDLETLVRRFGPMRPERAVYLLEQVANSLAEAHQQGLVHRDIKPSNIFDCRMGPDVDFIKVLDFGLVKEIGQLGDNGPTLTHDGFTPGTPAFMAPEVALGTREIDARADVYMLGCVAYWLLTGELVFDGSTPVSIIAQHVHDEPVPVSERAELDVPLELERLVMDCLAKEPEDRPRDAGEVRRRLAAIHLAQPWSQTRALHWWQVHRPC